MHRREWRLTALVLGCLALLSAGMTAWVLVRERPENVAAFETRFLDLSGLAFETQDGLLMEVQPEALTIRWEAGGTEPLRAAATVALEPGDSGATLTVYASGQQNALAGERWGYQVWLEWTCLSQADGREITQGRIELPMESDKERSRACTVSVCAAAGEACSVRAALCVSPLDGTLEAGWVTLADWEVSAW